MTLKEQGILWINDNFYKRLKPKKKEDEEIKDPLNLNISYWRSIKKNFVNIWITEIQNFYRIYYSVP